MRRGEEVADVALTTAWTVGELAKRSGVTVRTLHHYDETGLLSPSGRSDAGYRLYGADDVARLQRILFYRELGFALDDIRTLLDDPSADATAHLRRQHALLTRRIARLQDMQASVELQMEARTMGIELEPDEMLEVFGEDYVAKHDEYEAEAQERWGETDAWAQSRRRTSRYTKEDWQRIKAQGDAATALMLAAMRAGEPPTSQRAMAGAEAHRRHIDESFYDCSHRMQRGLADMYLADARFTKTYEDMAEGFAQFVHDAIHANADRADAEG